MTVLDSQGYLVKDMKLQGQPFGIYYSPDGRPHKLPTDPYSQKHYLALGFTFTKPINPITSTQSPLEDKYVVDTYDKGQGCFSCGVCGESFDSEWRLGCHNRTHKKRSRNRLNK